MTSRTMQTVVRPFVEHRSWSVVAGCRVARVSMADDRGGEHYAILDAEMRGKDYRERRARALEAIEASIADGNDPGQVYVE